MTQIAVVNNIINVQLRLFLQVKMISQEPPSPPSTMDHLAKESETGNILTPETMTKKCHKCLKAMVSSRLFVLPFKNTCNSKAKLG